MNWILKKRYKHTRIYVLIIFYLFKKINFFYLFVNEISNFIESSLFFCIFKFFFRKKQPFQLMSVRYYYNKNETFIFIKPYFKMLFIVTCFEYSEALILCYEQSLDGRMEMTTDVTFMIKFSLLFMSLESRLEF